MSLGDFELTYNENRAFEQLQEAICAYMYQNEITLTESPEVVLHKEMNAEKSTTTYLRVLDAVTDSKDTMTEVLQELHRQFMVKQYIIVEGNE